MASAALEVCSETSVIAREPRSVHDLPDEMLLKIFSYIEPEDLYLNISKVCEKWNAVIKDILQKTLVYNCDTFTNIIGTDGVLTAAPALHSLIILSRIDVADILEFLFCIHGDLRKLILQKCWLGEKSPALLANIVSFNPNLEVLSLDTCLPLGSFAYGHIPRLKNLSELDLSNCKGLSAEMVRDIVDSCKHLKKIMLEGNDEVVDDDVVYIIDKLGHQLTVLGLPGFHLTDVAYLHLQNCVRLQELELSRCYGMTDSGLLEGVGALQQLTSLQLDTGELVTAKAWSTFLCRPSMTSIVSLKLSCFKLDEEVLKQIAERCIHLEEMKVAGG